MSGQNDHPQNPRPQHLALAEALPPHLERAARLERIFMPYATAQRQALYANGPGRFVHYTSAEAALSIIRSKCLWMRNSTCMSDYREVIHGFEILNAWFSNPDKRKAFSDSLNTFVPGAAEEAIAFFNQWWNDTRFNTYITSISEHDTREDLHGRLSMWRAFGGNTARVAIVINVPYYSEASIALNVLFSPVAYLSDSEVHQVIVSVMNNVRSNHEFLQSVERTQVVGTVFNMLLAGVVCLKHEGFREEREWRVIYAPKRLSSPLIEAATETVGGVPQIIHKLPLDKRVSDTIADIDLTTMFDRLIIGPSPYPWVMYEAFVGVLSEIGIADARERVFVSRIPIRS